MNSIFKFLVICGLRDPKSNENENDQKEIADEIMEKIKELNDKNGPFDVCIVMGANMKKDKKDQINGLTIYWLDSSDSLSKDEKIIHHNKNVILWNMDKNSNISLLHPLPSHVDILITNYWPCHLRADKEGSLSLTQLLAKIPVRYHFICGDNFFWERDPFDIPSSRELGPFSISRAISLGDWKNPRQKYLYAFKIDPTSARIRPLHTTSNPYINESPSNFFFSLDKETKKRTFQELQNAALEESKRIEKMTHAAYGMGKTKANIPSNPNYKCHRCMSSEHYQRDCPWLYLDKDAYICHSCHQPGHSIRKCPKKKRIMENIEGSGNDKGNRDDENELKTRNENFINRNNCWFCLSNPLIKRHLIIENGNGIYVALAKGPLHPYHVLIIPIEHEFTISNMNENIRKEMDSYKEKYFKMISKEGYFMVTWNMNIQENLHHWHIQMIPLEMGKLEKFKEYLKYSEEERRGSFVKDREALVKGEKIQMELMIKTNEECIKYYSTDRNPQGGRRIMAYFLDKQELFDWKSSKLTPEDEIKMIQEIKSKIEIE